VTAVSNPKGWAFMVAILPPFIDPSQGVYEQLAIFTSIILLSETIAMFIYATGGKGLKKLLVAKGWEAWINKIGGLLLVLVGIFLLFS
jgi:threonine/homoserine/homoserine lactone efflux protein